MACLASPPSWEAPIVRFKKNATVLNSNDLGEDRVDFIWPAWNEYLDYSSASDPIDPERPRVWLVWHDGVLWYPTLWYSSAHIGKPPTEAKSQIGQPAGYRNIQDYKDQTNPTPGVKYPRPQLVNQGGPIRVWLRCPPGTEEKLSSFFWTYQNFLFQQVAIFPVTSIYDYCDRPLQVVPLHTMPTRNADPPAYVIWDNYFPGSGFFGYKIQKSQGQDGAGKYETTTVAPDQVVKQGQDSPFIPTILDTPGWDPVTGKMQEKIRALERSPYYIERGLSYTPPVLSQKDYYQYENSIYGSYSYFSAEGSSYTLWQKRARTAYFHETKSFQSGDSSITFARGVSQAAITQESPPNNRMMLVHPNPIPGYPGFSAFNSSGLASYDYFQGNYWFAEPRRSSIPPYESLPADINVGTRVTTSTQDIDIVSIPVHPAFARRGVEIKLIGTKQNYTSSSFTSSTGSSSSKTVGSISYDVTTKGWTPTDSQKILSIYPSLPWTTTYVGTPTEVPEKPLALDSQKVVSSYQTYFYSYYETWSTQNSSRVVQTTITRGAEVITSGFAPD